VSIKRIKEGLVAILIATVATGCSVFSGPSPELPGKDLSSSHYVEDIRKKADELSISKNPEDTKTAAELYAQIRDIENMDNAAIKYFRANPGAGIKLLTNCQRVHDEYDASKK
jgi:hypothetical protein